jgi:adenosine kinase
LAVNQYEWEMIEEKTGLTLDGVLNKGIAVIITHGKEGAKIHTVEQVYDIPPVEPVTVVDPTGGGDAFRAGLLRGIELGLSWDIAGRIGSLAAAYAIEKLGTQNHHYTPAEFVQRYRQHYDDNGALDILL